MTTDSYMFAFAS